MESIVGTDAVFAFDIVNGMDSFRVIKDSLGQRRLARIDMGADADITNFLIVNFH
jgi:hypothetical protein